MAQDELEELTAAAETSACPKPVTEYFGTVSASVVSDFFRDHTRYFADIDAWEQFIRSQNLSIGTRFHGNLIALINGVPALMIIHDSRTMEMCTLMGIPSIHLSELGTQSNSGDYIAEQINNLDFTRFERAYCELYKRYVGFLNANGLPHNLMSATL